VNVWVGLLFISGCACMEKADEVRSAGAVASADAGRWQFDNDPPGRVPENWRIAQTNPTESLAAWAVMADTSAPSAPNVMALTKSANYDGTFNLAIAGGTSYGDLDLTVRAKAVSGEEDQGGGPIWRCRDENNYYICRFNPLESNFRVYVVREGKRKQLDSATVKLEAGRWYTLRVTMIGDQVTCWLDGEQMLEATDDTIPGGGMIGLWTKADAVTSFDNLEVEPITVQGTP